MIIRIKNHIGCPDRNTIQYFSNKNSQCLVWCLCVPLMFSGCLRPHMKAWQGVRWLCGVAPDAATLDGRSAKLMPQLPCQPRGLSWAPNTTHSDALAYKPIFLDKNKTRFTWMFHGFGMVGISYSCSLLFRASGKLLNFDPLVEIWVKWSSGQIGIIHSGNGWALDRWLTITRTNGLFPEVCWTMVILAIYAIWQH